ncbi:phospholipase A2 inhibitor 25 kDa subunit-like isoform X1 [Anomaloglossus baeobatrachus]|uniref:phospholipase A2 inhibitor 25 kDa subunit-like isoform X1 n=2 Tax=Anomaloglossus baeobatrachus TaxID=238106 RepID=UPI003F4F7396
MPLSYRTLLSNCSTQTYSHSYFLWNYEPSGTELAFKNRTMTSLIGILSLLSTFAATSYALTCSECVSTSSSCSGRIVVCPSGLVCGSAYSRTLAGGRTIESFVRSCTPTSKCHQKGSISTEHGIIKMVTACCDTDNCTPQMPPFPVQSYDHNGLVCRTCLSADSTWCYTQDTMQCTGEENMCLLQTTKLRGKVSSSVAIRGCATKSICDLESQSQSLGDISMEVKFSCTSGATSVHKVVVSPAIACLLLLKLSL